MVRRIVQQLDDFTGMVDEIHEALKELRTYATAFRAIVDLNLDMRNNRPFVRWDVFPPTHQAVCDEIAGLEGASKCQILSPFVFVYDAKGRVFFLTTHVIVCGTGIAACLPGP